MKIPVWSNGRIGDTISNIVVCCRQCTARSSQLWIPPHEMLSLVHLTSWVIAWQLIVLVYLANDGPCQILLTHRHVR